MSSEDGLIATAVAMVAEGKGILAIDETSPTCTKRFTQFGIASTEETRRAYREMLVTTPGISEYIRAAILFDETIRQKMSDGRPFGDALTAAGIIPGIKVDTGARPLAKAPGETVTEGLDGLRERLKEYRELGARFTKWRAVIRIGLGLPSWYCIQANAHALGRYATLAQEAGLVPIVEPEVLMDGDHDIQRSQEVTEEVLLAVFDELSAQRCLLEGVILKPSMVTVGSDSRTQTDATEIAKQTLTTLRRCVPAAVPGIAFLSGGQTGEEACANLNAMASRGSLPWELSFSFGRALQYPALQIWGGEAANVPAAQLAFLHRARMSSLARAGGYSENTEQGRQEPSRRI
ncbi:MAG TPA: class I fructose-bisphosphate aldolase [Dehalococcoidia bacterium]|jgi:fructose-bisphosphate aldolase class I|nr:class I fructose-bisphosphate aldolase [Dehalococcoidia bacterium]